MNSEHPDRDSLSAYLEESLSIDAAQWIKQHLSGCAECTAKLNQERAFLDKLEGLSCIKAPADFTEGVMARVAQYPAYHPAQEVPWRRAALWGGSAVAAMFVVALFIGWVLVAGGSEQGVQVPTGASAVKTSVGAFTGLYNFVAENTQGIRVVLQEALGVLLGVFNFVREAGLMVQLALLLVTVGLNYALTRMVLNYQRRQ
jgi:predicted anti-sigma-YlaC factor YlaD